MYYVCSDCPSSSSCDPYIQKYSDICKELRFGQVYDKTDELFVNQVNKLLMELEYEQGATINDE